MYSSCTEIETPSEALHVKTEKLRITKPSTSPSDHMVSPSPVGPQQQIGPWVPIYRPKKTILGGYSIVIDDSAFKRVNAVEKDVGCGDGNEVTGGGVVYCDKCKESHPSIWFICPKEPCTMCFKLGQHHPVDCPYKRHIPKGADYDRVKYETICGLGCGHLFDEDKWACTFCSGTRPMLVRKFCDICGCKGQHGAHECPKDLVRAAQRKEIRDRRLFVGSRYSSKT